MSEEILKALMQLFALLVKQDAGVDSTEVEYIRNFLNQQLTDESAREYLRLFEQHAGLDEESRRASAGSNSDKVRLTSVKDSVRILGICKKINKTLTQQQKVVVLVRLFEIVNATGKFSDQRMAILNTVAEVFNLEKEEFESISMFVTAEGSIELDFPEILFIRQSIQAGAKAKYIQTEALDRELVILQVKSVDLYFLKYTGCEDVFLNGLPLHSRRIYLFASGSTIKLPKGKPVYYSDVVSHFLSDSTSVRISYQVEDLNFHFRSGTIGLRNISFSENQGKLVGIMGASGSGKTTLLNVLSGTETPTSGNVLINGINLHSEKDKLEGVIGVIPQDDLLIEELTVFENLYYNARLCFRDKTDSEIRDLVDKTLSSLGLIERKDLKVGSPLNKMISGGQRKRLNIALELIREPSILFVDEPTSGLSSRDSENVMDLLRELSLKGKLVFVVIHQPSSDIFKMFDNMMILDTGGYMIFYGNPVEAVMYFKRLDQQINSELGECPACGNVNPELIFNIIEARVVDEFGRYTPSRKVTPARWEQFFSENINVSPVQEETTSPPGSLRIPSWISQIRIYTLRDFVSKISNTQYIALNLLEAPLLAFILAYLIRYIADPNSSIYIFRENENIPVYIFMSLIVALFLGLTVSAEEIFRDRKILKREAFLNLSRSGYLVSKIMILFTISAIQALLFVSIGNAIIGLKGMNLYYWLALFSLASFANMLGLNISSAFNSAVTIYILIPLLLIPQMILGGAMFSFEKLNRSIGSVDKVPMVAEIMATKWAYEALMVKQFKDNAFQVYFFDIEKRENSADFKKVYLIPELRSRLDECTNAIIEGLPYEKYTSAFLVLRNEVLKEQKLTPQIVFSHSEGLRNGEFDLEIAGELYEYFDLLDQHYTSEFEISNRQRENIVNFMLTEDPAKYRYLRDHFFNESLSDIVKKVFEKNKILEYKHELVQQINPIYRDPLPSGPLSFRTHFFSPEKHLVGRKFGTYGFNVFFIWILTALLYFTLYYDVLKKAIGFFDRPGLRMGGNKKPVSPV
jgi:ABC transport system ATP-binding/permease protein